MIDDRTTTDTTPPRRNTIGYFAVAAVGALLCIGAAVFMPRAFWPAYLVAVTFVLGISLGSLGISLLHRLTGGAWGLSAVREYAAGAQALPLAVGLLLPLVYGGRYIYPWLLGGTSSHLLSSQHETWFIPWFWIARSIGYVAIWLLLAFYLQRSFRRASERNDFREFFATRNTTALGIVIFWLTTSFAAMDWYMAIEPKWVSTIYGAIVTMGFVVSGQAFALAIRPLLPPVTNPHQSTATMHDLGNLLLAFLLLWTYFSFSQFLIIWSGDLPYEITWYQRRIFGVWGMMGTALLVFQFVIPFALLLSRDVKRNAGRISMLAVWILIMRAVDLVWTILPGVRDHSSWWWALAPLTLVTAGSLWMAIFWQSWDRVASLALPVSTEEAHAAEHGHAGSTETST